MDDERRRAPRRAWSHGAANEAGWAVSRPKAAGPSCLPVSVAGGGRRREAKSSCGREKKLEMK